MRASSASPWKTRRRRAQQEVDAGTLQRWLVGSQLLDSSFFPAYCRFSAQAIVSTAFIWDLQSSAFSSRMDFFCQVQGTMIKRHASADSSSTRQCHGSHLPCHNNAMQQGAAKNGVGVQENIEVISRANSELKQERHLRSHVNVRMTEQWTMLEGELSA